MVFDPIEAVKKIEMSYKRYIKTTFTTDRDDYNEQIRRSLDEYEIVKGPYLQMPNRYRRGGSIRDLVSSDLLSPGFIGLHSSRLDVDMPLYIHQINAIKNIIGRDRSTVVSTGTGSGKTESFLIPILNHLLREEEAGTLGEPGVRAMIVYPMNALVNDQMKRFADVLGGYPKITFGFFTGETRELKDEEDFNRRFHRYPLENELFTADRMREDPPRILITNYVMLEHILIRPENSVEIFSIANAPRWKYIVLDEVHTYSGAKGTEVAMLLRRVNATISNGNVRFILTSATLGSGQDAPKDAAAFARELTGQDITESDIIGAVCEEVHHPDDPVHVSIDYYRSILTNPENIPEDAESVISSDEGFDGIVRCLEGNVRSLEELSVDTGMEKEDIIEIIEASSRVVRRSGGRLFEARYHTFVRTLDGVYLTLSPSNKISFKKASRLVDGGEMYALFAMSTCYNCGAVYIPGRGTDKLLNIDSTSIDDLDGNGNDRLFMLCNNDEYDENHDADFYYVCSLCRAIRPYGSDPTCSCGVQYANLIREVTPRNEKSKLCTCFRCGQENNKFGIVRDFYLGSEAATAALASSLFNVIPEPLLAGNPEDIEPVKQFLMFSDSRKSASYAAVNLEDSHHNLLMHRLQVELVKDMDSTGIGFDDLHVKLAHIIREGYVNREEQGAIDSSKKEAGAALLQEAVNSSSNKSLEFMGVYRFVYRFGVPVDGMDGSGSEALLNTLLKIMRERRAVYHRESSVWNDGLDLIRGSGYISVVAPTSGPEPPKVKGRKGGSSKKAEYLIRGRLKDYLEKVAPGCIEEITTAFRKAGCIKSSKGEYSVDLSKLRLEPVDSIFECTRCRKHFPFSVRGICPNCSEKTLVAIESPIRKSKSHYATMYREMPMDRLEVREHTAQLRREDATLYQDQFVNQELNALSCSTTFEMGVDIGSLSYVFMRNVPPSPSNYAQRAGRAGRSDESSAFILTFCRTASHDSHFFNVPEEIIKGIIHTPHINILNPKIVIRHIFASAIAFFWKNRGESPKRFYDMAQDSYIAELCSYLDMKDPMLQKFLEEIVPDKIADYRSEELSIDIQNQGWIDTLIGENGRLTMAIRSYAYDIGILEKEKQRLKEEDDKGFYNFKLASESMKNEDTLKMLSSGNIIPKYGFPVDTIQLSGPRFFSRDEEFELQRDATMAISEYAPGCQVVANGKIITSTHMKRMSDDVNESSYHSEDKYRFIICKNCGTITFERTGSLEPTGSDLICRRCGLPGEKPGFLVVPRLGFSYSKPPVKATVNKPRRSRGVSVYYTGEGWPMFTDDEPIGNLGCHLTVYNDSELAVVSNDRYLICERCGYGRLLWESSSNGLGHPDRFNHQCNNTLRPARFAHLIRTDVATVHFDCPCEKEWSKSVLYALIEGLCREFDLERTEISGCVVPSEDTYDFVLFDNTPGGSGYVKAITKESIPRIIDHALRICEDCDCGGEEGDDSCYRCLRNYSNQRDHDELKRGLAIKYLRRLKAMMRCPRQSHMLRYSV